MTLTKPPANTPNVIPIAIQKLLDTWENDTFSELPTFLPPMCDIQHHIDLTLGSKLPNLQHYHMSPTEHDILQKQVNELFQK